MCSASHITFVVPGPIRGKQRARHVVLAGGKTRSYTPKETVSNEKLIREYASLAMGRRAPFIGPMSLMLQVYKVMPASWSQAKRKSAFYVTGKPDCDNIGKLASDALNKLVWHDDAQIAMFSVVRIYGDTEYTVISIRALEDR